MWIVYLADSLHEMSTILNENKISHFKWILCLVDNSHEMSSLIFCEKYIYKKMAIKTTFGTVWKWSY